MKAANGNKAIECQEPSETKASEQNQIHNEVNEKLRNKRKADDDDNDLQPEKKKKNGLCNNSTMTPNNITC